MVQGPRIVVTITPVSRHGHPETAPLRHARYREAIERHGGVPILVAATDPAADREAVLASMDGLVLAGGGDIDPARYGRPAAGSHDLEPDRDELEAAAWTASTARGLPVLGICRGLQAINVFSGGTLLQDVAGHGGPSYGTGPARSHRLRLVAGSRLARILYPTFSGGRVVTVNTYHHQAVTAADLAPGLLASAWAASPAGELVEGLESNAGRFVVAVQCHPERPESTPPEFDRLFAFFVDACRGSAAARFSRGS
jgi:gamma-glutamyl-gamma-aminobutyrate hydrolase PuuD